MSLKIIYDKNISKEYIGSFTEKEKIIINDNLIGKVLNLFSGKSEIGNIRIDYLFGNVKIDVFLFLENFIIKNIHFFDTIIIDAPYNRKYAIKYANYGLTGKQFIIFSDAKKTTKLFKLIEKVYPKRIILKSFNYYIPKGYKLKEGYLFYFGGYRKSTILEILDKK